MVYFNEISPTNGQTTTNQSNNSNEVIEKKEVKVVPVGQNSEDKKPEDADKLPQGYYIEKSQDPSEPKKDEDDEEIDTSVNPDDKIEYDSIALDQADQVDDVIKSAYARGITTAVSDENKLDKALTMIKNDPYEVLNKDFQKGLHGTVIAKGEADKHSMSSPDSYIGYSKHTAKIDANLTYESKSGNTKLMFFGSGTKTNVHVEMSTNSNYSEEEPDLNTSVNDTEVTNNAESSSDDTDVRNKYNEYSIYVGGKQKIGKDVLSGSVLHLKQNTQVPSNTTQVDLKYDMDKYNATIKGSTIIYNANHRNIVQKTDISCEFNTKEEDNVEEKMEQEQPAEQTQEQNTDNNEVQENNKKWQKKGGLLFDIESINGEYEQGIGYAYRFKKKGENSVTRVVPFAKASTTQRDEDANSYYLTSGVIVKSDIKLGANSSLQASMDLKDKITVIGKDKGNIFTANGSVKYRSRKIDADLNAKYIVAGQTYAGLDAKLSYKPNKNVQIFCKANIVKQKEKYSDENVNVNIDASAIQGGVCVNF